MQEQETNDLQPLDRDKKASRGSIVVLNGTNPKTAQSLHEITKEANKNHSTWKVSSFQMELVDPNNFYLGYVENDELIGYIGSMHILDEASINNFGVLPIYKRKGIGTALMEELVHTCREKRIQKIFLEVRLSNQPAYLLYKKIGFEKIGYRKEYYVDPVEDAYLLCLPLHPF